MVIQNHSPERTIKSYSNREINWIYWRLNFVDTRKIQTSDQKREFLKKYINENVYRFNSIQKLHIESQSHLLLDDELVWIDWSDSRFPKWIKHELSSNNHFDRSYPFDIRRTTPDNQVQEYFLIDLDKWTAHLRTKRRFLSDMKSRWHELRQRDQKMSWLEKDNEKQISWAWQYISDHFKCGSRQLTARYNPTSCYEMYSNIFSIFDTWDGHPAELREHQGKMKQAWAQQKYRSNLNGRRQSTFVLSEDAKSQLQSLAKDRNVNLNSMLEYIIKKEFIESLKNKEKNH